jgi:hypothetical protein
LDDGYFNINAMPVSLFAAEGMERTKDEEIKRKGEGEEEKREEEERG